MHIPVLLNEVLKHLEPEPNENFIDCTFGAGGHAIAILEKIGPKGKLLGIERDGELLEQVKSRFQILDSRFQNNLILVCGNFTDLKEIVDEYNFRPVHGILFDLGLSSWHLGGSRRGFSFKRDEILDMRYSRESSLTAQEVLNKYSQEDLIRIFQEFGQEKYSKRIAQNVIRERKIKPIKTTFQLVEIIKKSIPFSKTKRGGITRVAARIFQALRIAVNDELGNLKKTLPRAIEVLEPRGRIVVISFHSLEDRIVKQFLKEGERRGSLTILTRKPVIPSENEAKRNPRSRSAKLRGAVKK